MSDLPPAKRARLGQDTNNTQNSQTYGLHVTTEEVDQLREFQVLDEVKCDDEDSNDEGSDKSDSSEGLDDEEIQKMLEDTLPDDLKGVPQQKSKKFIRREKIILEEKGINYFEVLPLDWMMVRHCSGMPIYMHRASRVCTLSKPYFLGKGNTRRHDIPISAIPCLAYRIALKEEEKQIEIDKRIAEQIKNGTWTDPNKPTEKTVPNGESTKVNEAETDVVQNDSEAPEAVSQELNGEKGKCPFSKNFNLLKQYGADSPKCFEHESSQDSVIGNNVTESVVPDDEKNGGAQTDLKDEKTDPKDIKTPTEEQDSQQATNLDGKDNQEPHVSIVEENVPEFPGCGILGEESQRELDGLGARPVLLPGGIVMPPPRVETVSTSWKSQQLTAEELNAYCKRLFKFKQIYIMHFKRWADRRKFTKARKTMQYPKLPEGTKLITIPAQDTGDQNGGGKSAKRDWVMNMNGCSYLSVFHEYVRRALHKQPVYEFKQLENATAPYQATVYIGGMQYGVGRGSSKRQAKSQAARASIHILIPEMRDELPTSPGDLKLSKDDPDFTFFDYVSIEDPRIQEFCGAAAEPSPHAILRTCLLRNFGVGDRHIHTEMKKLEFQKIELTMKVGKHTATVVCKNKKQAKQRASQHILQQLHPHITSWGSLLRLYGSRSMKSCKEKKLEEQQITLLQDKARHNEPNHAVLDKLRNEMTKLKERDNAVVPIGTLLVSEGLPTHSGSNLNNVDL